MSEFVYQQTNMPACKSAVCDALAKHFYQTYMEWQWARMPLVAQWDENDRVFLCKRKLPEIDGFPFLDPANPWGPTDIFDYVNQWAMRMSLAMFPKDDTWCTLVAKNAQEPPATTNAAKAQHLWMHRQIRTRLFYGMHLRQVAVRGTSTLFLDWRTETITGKVISARAGMNMRRYARQTGMPIEQMRAFQQMSKIVERKVIYNGPVIRVMDTRDVLFDPEADLSYDRKIPMIIQTYRRPSDLENEIDAFGNKVYENLDDLPTMKASELYYQGWDMTGRLTSLNMLGINPQHYTTKSADLAKVLVCYAPYLKFEGYEFYDTYFHIAERFGQVRIIRMEASPTTENGARHLLTDTFIDWFTGHPYGISSVEKLVPTYDRAAFIDALQLSSGAAAAFPAIAVPAGTFKDDIVDRTPSAINEIAGNISGPDLVHSLPSTQPGAEFAMQQLKWYSEKMAASFGSYTNIQDNPTRSVSSRKTATEANIEASGSNLSIDEQTEKFSPTQQEACQWMLDMSQVKLTGDVSQVSGKKVVTYGVTTGNSMIGAEMTLNDFQQPRTVEILGQHGAINKQQSIQNKVQALTEVVQLTSLIPNGPALAQNLLQGLFSDLNLETLPTVWLAPEQLAAQNPQVMQQAAMNAIQNPQIMIQMLLKAFDNPEILKQALLLKMQMDQQAQKAQMELGVILSGRSGPTFLEGGPTQQPQSGNAPPINQVPAGRAAA